MITIAICTWNRSAMLDRILGMCRALEVPAGVEWELMVVNNNCSDDTDDVIAKHAAALPMRRAFEPQAGIAHARNRALVEASGELILWTDDDMAVPPDWMKQYLAAAECFPDASLFGGPIRGWFAEDVTEKQKQFTLKNIAHLSPMFGLIDFGPEVRELRPGEFFFSGNMALRTAAARKHRFDGRFGRVGRAGLLGGEETLFLQQMRERGERGVWVGNAHAEHYIPAERLTRDYAWNYFKALGRTQARIDGIPACPTLFGKPRWALWKHWQSRCRGWLIRQIGGNGIPASLTAAKLAGYLDECDAHRLRRPPGFLVPPHHADA